MNMKKLAAPRLLPFLWVLANRKACLSYHYPFYMLFAIQVASVLVCYMRRSTIVEESYCMTNVMSTMGR